MTNIDKVIEGLECCQYSSKAHCDECPYVNDGLCSIDACTADLASDALDMLKEQEDTRLISRKPYHTKVEYANGGSWITDQCPECVERGVGIWDTLVDRYVKYCRRCGQALDWSEYNDRDKIDWDEYMSHVGERANRIIKRR